VSANKSSRPGTSSTSLYVDDKIRDYIVDIVLATRPPIAAANFNSTATSKPAPRRAPPSHSRWPRAPWPFLNGRHFVTPQDVKTSPGRAAPSGRGDLRGRSRERHLRERHREDPERPARALDRHAGRHHQIHQGHHERHAAAGDPHAPHGQRQPGRRLPLGVQGPRHGLRRGARIQPRRRSPHHRLERHGARRPPLRQEVHRGARAHHFLVVDISASGNFGSGA
jgi:hypothetical protein